MLAADQYAATGLDLRPPCAPPPRHHAPRPCPPPCQVRKFAADQYAATGLNLHRGLSPVEVVKQPDGRLTVVLQDKAGARTEVADCDQVWGRGGKGRGAGLRPCAREGREGAR